MLKRYHRVIGGAFRIVDALVIGAVWLISYWVRFHISFIPVTKGFPDFETYAAVLPLVMGIWVIVFSSMKLYQSQRMLRRTHEVHLILKAHFVSMLFFIALTYLFSEYKYSRGVILYLGVFGGLFLVLARLALRNGLRAIRRRGFNLRHAIAIGEGGTIETVIHRLEKFPEMGIRVIGALTSKESKTTNVAGKKVLGHYEETAQWIRSLHADIVLLALPRKEYGELDRILESIQDETVDIRLIPDVHEYVTLGCEVEDFEGLPVVNLNDSPLFGWGALAKRSTDAVLSFFGLILLSPVFALISAITKITSRGPVFYSQERMGLDGRTFPIYKFRSMKIGAEKETGAVWAKENDDRKTSWGAFLRKTSLDELPQLWNVLRGDMSLVGPRPERPVFVKRFRNEVPHYMLRHKVKAGLTGWAQINGWRGNTSIDRRIEYDLYYIRNWSYMMDLKILALTPFKGFANKNAY